MVHAWRPRPWCAFLSLLAAPLFLPALVGAAPASDTEPPTLSGTPTVEPSSVDVSGGPASVHVEAHLLDNDSGVSLVIFSFGVADSSVTGGFAELTAGTPVDGTWSGDIIVPQNADGIFTLTVSAFDNAVNVASFPTAVTLTVTGGDPVPPALAGTPTVLPNTVDVSGGDREVAVTIPLRDSGTGVAVVEAQFSDAEGSGFAFGSAELVSGTPSDGVWISHVIIPQNTPAGTYHLGVGATDGASNSIFLETDVTLQVGGSDVTPPVLDGVATLEPDSVSLDLQPVTIALHVPLRDEQSGVAGAIGDLRDGEGQSIASGALHLAAGNANAGSWEGEVTVPAQARPGDVSLFIIATDGADNSATIATGKTLIVTRLDPNAPTLAGEATLDPETVNVSGGARSVQVTFPLADDRSGVEFASVELRPVGEGDILTAGATRASGDSLLGSWRAVIEVPGTTPQGDLGLWVDAQDAAGNAARIDAGKLLHVARDVEASITFQVDMRGLMRRGLYRRDGNMTVYVDLFDAPNRVAVPLADAGSDSIYSASVLERVGSTLRYAFAFDAGFADSTRWIYELGGHAGGRSFGVTSPNDLTLDPVFFDNALPTHIERPYVVVATRSFDTSNNGLTTFDDVLPTYLSLRMPALNRSAVVAVRRYEGSAGGVAPPGIAVLSSSVHWGVSIYPPDAVYTARPVAEYDLYGGVADPSALRWLRRSGPESAWEIVPTTPDFTERTMTGETSQLEGDWTLGSVSAENTLLPTPPEIAGTPNPPDGAFIEEDDLLFGWAPVVGARTYDIYIWEDGTSRPAVPTAAGMRDPEFLRPHSFPPLTAYEWQVVSKNLAGSTPGPIWSFRVDQAPDLEAGELEASPVVHAGENIEVRWTVANVGGAATNAAQWSDVLFLSLDPDLDPRADAMIGFFQNPGYLAPGEAYANRQNVRIPDNKIGECYLFLETNYLGLMPEQSLANNRRILPIRILPAEKADLEVTELTCPDRFFSGQPIVVSWRVRNRGARAAVSTDVSGEVLGDGIYISADSVFDAGGDLFLASAPGPLSVAPDSSYSISLQITPPDSIYGDRYLFLVTDILNQIPEDDEALNNRMDRPIAITLTPPPDLAVAEVQAPASASSGRPITVHWRVANRGPGSIDGESWSDRVTLVPRAGASTDSIFTLGSFSRAGDFAPDSTYASTETVDLPEGISGPFTVRIASDWDGRIFEYTYEDNNALDAATTTVSLSPWPDLEPVILDAPAEAEAGEQIALRWVVRNAGADTTRARWVDRVSISQSATWDSATARPLAAVEPAPRLAPDGEYVVSTLARLDPTLAGASYLYLMSDADRRIYERTAEGNNRLAGVPIHVRAFPVDLRARTVASPAVGDAGRPVTVEWSVVNEGTGKTLATAWTDAVYLSTDTRLDLPGDVRIGLFRRSGPLDAGEGYARSVAPKLPNGISGTYYLLIRTDVDGEVVESDRANNVAVSQPIVVTLPPSPDLRVESVAAPASAAAGQPMAVSFLLRNAGAGPAPETIWYQAFHLSKNALLEEDDLLLGTTAHTGAIASGATSPETVELEIPAFASGTYYLIVQADSRDDVYEHQGEGNNTALALVAIDLPPPTDLVVREVTIDPQSQPGDSVTVAWILENRGTYPAQGILTDAVYVSPDSIWNVDKPLVGTIRHRVDVAPGVSVAMRARVSLADPQSADAEGNLREPLPGLATGSYHGIVRTNIRDNIRETDLTNNLGVSIGLVQVGVPELPFDLSTPARLAQGQRLYYRLEVPTGGETVSIELEGSDGAFRELYASFGEPPSRSRHDYSGGAPFSPTQELRIPTAGQGTWYILAYADRAPAGTEPVTLLAHVLGFAFETVDPPEGGEGGKVTVKLTGSGIGPDVDLRLVQGATVLRPVRSDWLDATTSFATFDLTGAPSGDYDLEGDQVRSRLVPTGENDSDYIAIIDTLLADLPHAFRVVAPTSPRTDIRAGGPRVVRRDQVFELTVEAENLSNRDDRAPLLLVYGFPDFPKGPTGGEGITRGARLMLLTAPEGPPGILAPGATGRLEISGRAPSQSLILHAQVKRAQDSGLPFDFDRELALAGVDPNAPGWSDAVEAVRARGIDTWNDYAELLAETANTRGPGAPVPKEAEFLLLMALEDAQRRILDPHYDDLPVYDPSEGLPPSPTGAFPGGLSRAPQGCSALEIAFYKRQLRTMAIDFDAVNAPMAAKHLRAYLDNQVRKISYDTKSYAANLIRMHKSANRSFDSIHANVISQLRDQLRPVFEQSDCELPPHLPDFVFKVGKPDFYTKGTFTDIPVEDWVARELVLSFGGMQGASAKVKTLNLSTARLSLCGNACSIAYSGIMEYTFTDKYEFRGNDCVKSSWDKWGCYLLDCGEVSTIDTEVVMEEPFMGTFTTGQREDCDPPEPDDPWDINVVASLDPNDIVGPEGVGDRRWVAATDRLAYTVHFENDPDLATSPAQTVTVTQTLDAGVDPRSLRLGRFGFGSFTFDPPANASFYAGRLDVRDSLGVLVDVNAGIDVTRDEAFWVLKSIDPAGGDLPANPLLGFLLVDDAAGRGRGFVSYSVQAKPTARTGDEVKAQARIVFDRNAPIDTPEFTNALDADPPESRVRPLPAVLDSTAIAVAWDASDSTGAGVRTFALYVGKDDGPFELRQDGIEGRSLAVNGEFGHVYRFYVESVDQTGNRERAKSAAEASVRLDSTGAGGLPTRFVVHPNAPNPFRTATTLTFELPQPRIVTVRVYDLTGRLVLERRRGRMEAGRHEERLDFTDKPSGLYFVELRVRGESGGETRRTRKIVHVR